MTDEPQTTTNVDAMTTNPKPRWFTPFSIIFCALCNLLMRLFKRKPSALQLENDSLRVQIDSKKEILAEETWKNNDRENFNSFLDSAVLDLQSEDENVLDFLKLQEQEISRDKEQIDLQKERTERLEHELRNTVNSTRELEAQLNMQKALMHSMTAEWMCITDKQNQKNRWLEIELKKKYQLVEKQMRDIMTREMGLGQLQAITSALRSDKEALKKSCDGLELENSELKDALRRLNPEESN